MPNLFGNQRVGEEEHELRQALWSVILRGADNQGMRWWYKEMIRSHDAEGVSLAKAFSEHAGACGTGSGGESTSFCFRTYSINAGHFNHSFYNDEARNASAIAKAPGKHVAEPAPQTNDSSVDEGEPPAPPPLEPPAPLPSGQQSDTSEEESDVEIQVVVACCCCCCCCSCLPVTLAKRAHSSLIVALLLLLLVLLLCTLTNDLLFLLLLLLLLRASKCDY